MDKRYREQLKNYLLLLDLEGNKKKKSIYDSEMVPVEWKEMFITVSSAIRKDCPCRYNMQTSYKCSNFSIGIKRNSPSLKRNDINK